MANLLGLFGAGLLAGTMNALAGGGSFVTLPALIAIGLPSVIANASSTVALWPGSVAGAWTYFDRLRPVCGVGPRTLLAVTLLGGFLGSILLLWTPSSSFDFVLPWLLLLATLSIAFARRLGAAVQGRLRGVGWVTVLVQFALGLYGGYFGGAVGLMMVAGWMLLGEQDVKSLHSPRMMLVSVANSAAVLVFILAGAVAWLPALAMLLGGLVGGVAGAKVGLRIPPQATRMATLAISIAITAAFFVRAYAGR